MYRKPALAFMLPVLIAVTLAGCGSSAERPATPGGQLLAVPGSAVGKVVLTAQGAERLGLETSIVRAVRVRARASASTARVIIPFAAIVYSATGRTYAFTRQAPLTFVEVPVTVDHISGSLAYLRTGPRAGTTVVSVGAEELFGVQSGVLEQT